MSAEHPRPSVAAPVMGNREAPMLDGGGDDQGSRSPRTRPWVIISVAVTVVAVAAGVYAWHRDTASDSADQVRVYRDQLQCRGKDVRVGPNRVVVSGPDVECTGHVEIENGSDRDVAVTGVTFGLAGPGNSHAMVVTMIDGDQDVDPDGREGTAAGLELELDVAAGTHARVPYQIGYNPGRCDAGTFILGGWPVVDIDVMNHHFERRAEGRFAMRCS